METGEITLHKGSTPLLISVPHSGTVIPAEIKERMQPETLFLPDTDWFVDRLYGWAPVEGASLLATPWSRFACAAACCRISASVSPRASTEHPGNSSPHRRTFAMM